jgi:hypothetical protein
MRIPHRRGLSGIRRIISEHTQPVSVGRITETTGPLDETVTSQNDHTESLWLFNPDESVAQEITGEQLVGQLGGLAVADGTVDLEHNDRITYGGVEYEVDTVVGIKNDDAADGTASPDTDFWVISFVRRQ